MDKAELRRNAGELPAKNLHLKPPFEAEFDDHINCPLPLVKRFNPVIVNAWCHGWIFKDELCHHASYCAPYLDLLMRRINEGEPVNPQTLEKLGLDNQLIKRARR